MAKNNYYAYLVPNTHTRGVTNNWTTCQSIISGVRDARYKGFKTKKEADEWLEKGADYKAKKKLPKGIYFDAGTGRGEGVEISVTDEKGTDLLFHILAKKMINKHGKHLIGRHVTNNYGELLACKYALDIALKKKIKKIFGDSNLIISYWSKGYIKNEVAPETIELALRVSTLRRQFEQQKGTIMYISGDDNPADLGFHR